MIIVVKHGNDEAKLEKVVSFLEDRGLNCKSYLLTKRIAVKISANTKLD